MAGRGSAILAMALLALPASGQPRPIIPIPPPPDPEATLPTPTEVKPTWLEHGTPEKPDTRPPNRFLTEPPILPNPPPAAFAGSACNFSVWGGDNIFSPDYRSYQVLIGGYYSTHLGPAIPAFNFLPITVRKGWMLTAPDDRDTIIRGNWECLGSCSIAPIASDYGKYVVGTSFFLRKNYLALGTTCVPYTQIGAGLVCSDAYKTLDQEAIGSQFSFNVQAQVGLRLFVTDTLSLDVEGGFQHISNANLADRNLGVNAFGGQVGMTYHFPWGVR